MAALYINLPLEVQPVIGQRVLTAERQYLIDTEVTALPPVLLKHCVSWTVCEHQTMDT